MSQNNTSNRTTIATTANGMKEDLVTFIEHLEIVLLVSPELLNGGGVLQEVDERRGRLLESLEAGHHLSPHLDHFFKSTN